MIFMSQFTETSEEVCFNSQKLLGKIIIPYWLGNSKYPAKYQIKYEFATIWPNQYIRCTLYVETISSKLLKYVVNLLRHMYGTNVHAR